MRTRHATALSVAGVLAAGLVAALVNAQALAGSGALSDRALSSTQLVGSSPSVPSASTTPAANPAGSVVAPASTATTTVTQRLFSVGEAGVVTLDQGPDTLSLLAVTPAEGWSVTSVRSVGSDVIVIGFASSNSQLTAVATLSDSNISITLATAPPAGNEETTTSSTIESETIPPDPTVVPMDTASTPPIPTPTTQRPPAVRPPSSKPPAVRPPSSQPVSTLPTATQPAPPPPASTESPHAQPAPSRPASTQPDSTVATPSGATPDGTAGHGSDHGATSGSVVPDD